MVHGTRYAEGDVQLRLYHNAGLPDNKLERQHAAVKHRPCAGKLSAEALGEAAVARQRVRALDRVSDAHDNVGIGNVQALVHVVGAEIEYLGADIFDGEVDVLFDYFIFVRTAGSVLKRAGADGTDLGASHGNGDNGHHLAADGRLDELNVRRLRIPNELGRVRGAAGAETRSKARSKVAAVYRSADHDGSRTVFFAQNREQVRVRVVVEEIVARAGYADELIHAAVEHLLKLTVAYLADNDRGKLFTACVAQLARFRAQLERYRQNAVAVALDKDPHILEISLVHTCNLLKAHRQ